MQNSKIGAILCLIGSSIFLIVGLYWMTISRIAYGSIPFIIPTITALLNILLGAFGITGAVLVLRDFRWAYTFPLCAGIIGMIGTFIPTYLYDMGYGYYQTFYLTNSLLYADLMLMVMGAVLGIALVDKEERKL